MEESSKLDEKIEDVISSEEKVLWRGKRSRNILFFYFLAGMIITILIAIHFFIQGSVEHHLGSDSVTDGVAIGIFALIIGTITSAVIYANENSWAYAITDRKVIVEHGLFSKTTSYAYHKDVKKIKLKRGLLGNFFDTGTILVDTGKTAFIHMRRTEIRGLNMDPKPPKIIYDCLKDISSPQKTYNLIQRLVETHKEKPLDIIEHDPKKIKHETIK